MGIGHLQSSAKFLGAFAHSSDANARAAGPQLHNSVAHTFSVVPDLYNHLAFPLGQGNPGLMRPRMTKDIGERFLNNPEHCGFQIEREPGKIEWARVSSSVSMPLR